MFNPIIANTIYRSLKPRPRLTLSECADKYRYMSSVSSAHPGRWKTSVVEYTRDIMNAISDPNIQIIVIRKPAQVSGTEMILNAILYFIVQDPSSIIWTLPTLGMAEDYSKARLSAMIRDSWIFKEYLGADYYKQKKSNDTILHKLFPGARLLMTGSNSEIGVSGNPMRCFFGDEIDKYFITKGGDTIELGIKRTQTYEENRKIILTSTPSITGMSKIDEWYEKGDQRVYKVPCIKCGFKQVLKFKNIKGFRIEKGVYDAKKSFYECPKCKSKLNDHDLNRMVKKGSSVAAKKFNGIASFDLGCEIISPWVKMKDVVEGFVNCKANPELYREWVNLSLGESYNDTNIELNAGTLQKRAEKYDFTIPLDAGVLIGSADVHDDRIECVAMAFGVMEEQWIVEHHIFYGDASVIDENDPGNPWTQLDIYTQATFDHESGSKMNFSTFVIDSGHLTDQVYAFVKPREVRNIWAVRGSPLAGRPILNRPSKKNKGKVTLFNLGVFAAKEIIYSRLLKNEPGPGYIHFPDRLDTEFFEQVASEKKITVRDKNRRSTRKFIPTRRANHALDMLVYGIGGLRILNPDLEQLVKFYASGKVLSRQQTRPRGRRLRGKAQIYK